MDHYKQFPTPQIWSQGHLPRLPPPLKCVTGDSVEDLLRPGQCTPLVYIL